MSDRYRYRSPLAWLVALMAMSSGPAVEAFAAPVVIVDHRISIATQGNGPDAVLIPGLASSAHVWDRTVAHLAPHYRVHVVQVLGFAGTPPEANLSGPVIASVADAIHHDIATNHIAPVILIGHSMGGLVGMELAIHHPADIRRLLIVDTLPFFGSLMGAADLAEITPRAAAMRDATAQQSQSDYAAGAGRMTSFLLKTKGAPADAVTLASAASDHVVVAHALYEDMTTDLRGQIALIRQPTTLLYPFDKAAGMNEAATDALYRTQYAPLKGVSIERIDDSRHFIMIDQPAAFEATLDRFLAP